MLYYYCWDYATNVSELSMLMQINNATNLKYIGYETKAYMKAETELLSKIWLESWDKM